MRPLQLDFLPRAASQTAAQAPPASIWEWGLRQRELLAPFVGEPEADALRDRLELGGRRGLTADEVIETGIRAIGRFRVLNEGGGR